MTRPLHKLLLPLCLQAVVCVGSAHADGYLLNGQGGFVQSEGQCIKSGNWTAKPAVKGCDHIPKPARIVLLPAPNGEVGAVMVRNPSGALLLNKAYAGAQAENAGELQRSTESEASVKARYGDVLDARAPRPVSFTVRFETGSASKLTAESATQLAELNKMLANWPAPQLMIVGHTDRVGAQLANDALSLKRAQAVAQLLIDRGIPAQQIEAAGRGEREPLVLTPDGVAEAANRRVEITLR